jgi:hypothetical protein
MVRLRWQIDDAATLRRVVDSELLQGRAFVPGAAAPDERTPCEIVLAVGESEHALAGEVVFVRAEDPGRGVGVQLGPLDGSAREALLAFAARVVDGAQGDGGEGAGDDAASPMHERLRHLSNVEQQKVAGSGTLAERTALERMYGPNVWEALLRNPRLTPPEVARIAKKGNLPKPLLDLVGASAAWLAVGEVQRALLANPRTSSSVVSKILSGMSKNELLRVVQQTAYPMQVRNAAKRMIGA